MRTASLFLLAAIALAACNGRPEVNRDETQPATEPTAEEKNSRFDYTFEAEGRKFGTFLSSKYGPNDIWLAYSQDGKEFKELFTGCAVLPESWSDAYTAAYGDGKIVIVYERTTAEGSDAVQTRFEASLPQIERDSDKDGLTDLVEQRFMTDPTKPDTDGDGRKDGEDMNPLVSGKKKLSEQQEIWKAAYEQYPKKYPDLLQWPEDTFIMAVFDSEADYFELPGRKEYVVPATNEYTERFARQFGYDFVRVCFGSVVLRASREGNRRVEFEFEVHIRPRFGRGYILVLEQQGGNWTLVDYKQGNIY
jgi:hypothetical protein